MGWISGNGGLSFLGRRDEPTIEAVSADAEQEGPGAFGEKNIQSASSPDGDLPEQVIQPGELTLDEATNGGMGRHLGLVSTTFLIIGRIIGTGIFSTPSSITQGVGSVGAAFFLWVLGLILSACGLCVWLEFGTMFPRSGGEKVYLEAVYRRPRFLATVVFAIQAIVLGFTASGCIVFAQNIVVAAQQTPTEWQERGIAIAVIVFVTIIHSFTPKLGVWLNNAIGWVKVVILLFIVVTGWVVLSGRISSIPDPHASFRNAFSNSVNSGNLYASALFKVLNSYAGWSNAMYVTNEVKRPVHTLKIAGPLALGICGLLYILANVSYFAAATPAEIAASGTTVAAYFFGKVFGTTAERVLSVFVAISAFGNVLTITFAQARVNQELAKEGVVPLQRFWASTWPMGSPSAGLLLHFIPSFIMIVAIPFGDAFDFIVDVEGYPSSIISLFVVIGLIILRFEAPHTPRPFRVWWPVAILFLIGQCFLLVAPFLYPPGGKGDTSLPYWLYPIVGIVVIASGFVYWFVWRVALPWLGGYELEQHKVTLADGTVVTTFKGVKNA